MAYLFQQFVVSHAGQPGRGIGLFGEIAVLDGANAIAVENGAGEWEIVQFATAELVSDARKAEELWDPSYASWFPDGPTDPDLTLVAAEADVPILPGAPTRMWTFNGTFPGPTIRRPSVLAP